MKDKSPASNTITFLGTGGARFMVINQFLASGGLWLNLDGTEILVDPGPGCIVQATKRKLKAENLSAIIVSHRHLDHSADVNIMVEAMTRGGLKRHGQLFAPADALATEPIIFSYLKDRLDSVEILAAGKSYPVGNISFTTPVRHIHPVETYGLVFSTAEHTFSYITDTEYFDGLGTSYGGELLIINTVFTQPMHRSDHQPGGDKTASPGLNLPMEHLSVPDAGRIITELQPKAVILTHFGISMWRAKPWQIAKKLSRETGVRVLAARDGMRFDLAQLDSQD